MAPFSLPGFTPEKYNQHLPPREYLLIHGELENQISVTLIHCFDSGPTTQNFHGFEKRCILVNYAIMGFHTNSLEEPVFKTLSFRSVAATEWYHPFEVGIEHPKQTSDNNWKYEISTPKPIRFDIKKFGEALIWIGGSFPLGFSNDYRMHIA